MEKKLLKFAPITKIDEVTHTVYGLAASETPDKVIYLVTNTINGKMYVGKTIYTAQERWKGHVRSAQKGQRGALHCAIRKYGVEAFSVSILARAKVDRQLNALERKWIKKLNTFKLGYNNTLGGDGALGFKHTLAFRRSVSKRNKGKPMTEACKAALLATRLGKKHTDETRAKMREGAKSQKARAHHKWLQEFWRGRKHSPETIQKMKLAAKQRWARRQAA